MEQLFKLHAPFSPSGDQPEAIEALTTGLLNGIDEQVLLGVTGSGKTFTMANIIAKMNRPTLVLAHNKTLAAQLCSEFKEFFPENAVEYFVSYYDYYQPEAYIAHTDTYIEKDSATNDEIDRLRNSATASLLERRDVIVVSSVSCIYGLGDPEDYKSLVVSIRQGQTWERDTLLHSLIDIRYERNDVNFIRNTFRVRGDTVEVFPAGWTNRAIRIEFFGDEVDEYWMDQIDAMQDLRQGIVLRAYGQNDPVVEYKREGYAMFEDMIRAIQEETTRRMFLFRIQKNEPLKREKVAKVTATGAGDDKSVRREPLKKKVKVGRNDPCPCGSGKKYKNCCLDKDMAAGKNVQS